MKRLKKIVLKTLDIIELYIPMVLFSLVVIMYIMMIWKRYVNRSPISELYEGSQILYMVCAILAASYGGRTDRHAVFPLLYDRVSEKVQHIIRIVGNVIIIATMAVLISPSIESIQFVARKRTSILKVPFDLIYLPFMFLIVLTMLYYAVILIKDIRSCFVKQTAPKEEE